MTKDPTVIARITDNESREIPVLSDVLVEQKEITTTLKGDQHGKKFQIHAGS